MKKPRRHIKYYQGASGLAAGQPRKLEAAHIVDWFYVTSSFTMTPPLKGDRDLPLSEKEVLKRPLAPFDSTMRLGGKEVKMVFDWGLASDPASPH